MKSSAIAVLLSIMFCFLFSGYKINNDLISLKNNNDKLATKSKQVKAKPVKKGTNTGKSCSAKKCSV